MWYPTSQCGAYCSLFNLKFIIRKLWNFNNYSQIMHNLYRSCTNTFSLLQVFPLSLCFQTSSVKSKKSKAGQTLVVLHWHLMTLHSSTAGFIFCVIQVKIKLWIAIPLLGSTSSSRVGAIDVLWLFKFFVKPKDWRKKTNFFWSGFISTYSKALYYYISLLTGTSWSEQTKHPQALHLLTI